MQTHEEVLVQLRVLRVHGPRLERGREALALRAPPRVVHLREERAPRERREAFVLRGALRPVFVRDFAYEARVADVDDA